MSTTDSLNNQPALLDSVSAGEFHALISNKFEAAFTAGRAINYINYHHTAYRALGSLRNSKQWMPIVDLLRVSCQAFAQTTAQKSSLKTAISNLVALLQPTDDAMARSEDRANHARDWLDNPRESAPLDCPESLLESKTTNPLKVLLETVSAFDLSCLIWLSLGLEVDRVFRPVGLTGRIRR